MKRLFLILSLLLLGGCGQMRPLPPASGCKVPAWKLLPSKYDHGLTSGRKNLLEFAASNTASATFSEVVFRRLQSRDKVHRAAPRQVLVLSGGSLHGAFGAGFFRGMRDAVGIPDYDVVTAVSTGALQSTLVFLANRPVPADRTIFPDYMSVDRGLGRPGISNIDDLTLAYAIGGESDLLKMDSLGYLGAALHGSTATFQPLRKLIGELITPDTIRAVADEAGNGRSLFVGVTNLDDGYGYAIDLTQLSADAVTNNNIAAARECYIEALIASSSVPPGVPPVALTTDGTGPHLYMDGGARFGVFFDQLRDVVDADKPADMTLLVNGSLYGDAWTDSRGAPVKKWSVLSFGMRAVNLLENQVYRFSVGDAEQWGAANGTLRMAFISNENLSQMNGAPDDWRYPAGGNTCQQAASNDALKSAPQQFLATYMRCLIDYGEQRGRMDRWNKVLSSVAVQ